MIIGFTGHKGSGKDTAAEALVGLGFVNMKMADPLKDMLRALGLSEREIEGDLKEEPCAILCEKTPRYAMQTLGTEWRDMIGRDLWSRIWSTRAMSEDNVVCTDIRFQHEAEAVRALGGRIIRVERPGLVLDLSHSSEREMLSIQPDAVIVNDASRHELHEQVLNVCLRRDY